MKQFDRVLFPFSPAYITRGVMEKIPPQFAGECLLRHACGDWGDLDDVAKRVNDEALRKGRGLLSAYDAPDGIRLWIITEADRSETALLLPSEY